MTHLPFISHLSVGTDQLDAALAFYDKVMATFGAKRIETFEGIGAAYGHQYPEFWVQRPHNRQPASVGNGFHIAFLVPSKEAVHAFYQAALDAGGKDAGEPGPRPDYGPDYYACFVTDLDGHKIEAHYFEMPNG